MKPEDYQHACELFDAAWALPEEQRADRLRSLCDDEELCERVQNMLLHIATADRDGFLAGSAASADSCSALRPTTVVPSVGQQANSEPRFRPGQMIAGRYRVAVRLGSGGMGEVYRAEDLMLGQTVALKFLSRAHVSDSLRLKALLGEVRLGREVAHPNVCRVYDVSEMEGDRFISMELIEGEDLASQLRRVGRLHPQTALRVAREICLGLAALHECGVVHRDLKPGNIMLDRDGHVRIVDFGLAVAEGSEPSEIAGTLGYVAPECLRGGPPTPRSDLYSLGRLLERLFSNESEPLSSRTKSVQNREMPVVGNRAVREVIAKCLVEDASRRPASALEVARALGWDPLEEARVAGRLPSPEEVADAPVGRPLSIRLAWAALALAVIGMLLILQAHRFTSLFCQAAPLPPSKLRFRAREVLNVLGYKTPPVDVASDYRSNPAYRRGPLIQPALGFWYRESPRYLIPVLFLRQGGWRHFGTCEATFEDPPPGPGDTLVVLDAKTGRLCEFWARPMTAAFTDNPLWYAPLFAEAGLDPADYELPYKGDSEAHFTSIVPCQEWLIWEARSGRQVPTRVVAASFEGQPVYFRTFANKDIPVEQSFARPSGQYERYFFGGDLLLVALILTSAWLVPRNLRLGYADRSGALRMAAIVFLLRFGVWVLSAHHVAGLEEFGLLLMGLTRCLFDAAILWLFYVALEPAVRRLWPESLVSWNRLLAGRWRDPLVGSSILAGLALGVTTELVDQADILASLWMFPGRARLTGFWPAPEANPATIVASVLSHAQWAISFAVFGLLLLLVLRSSLRVPLLSTAGFVLVSYGLYYDYQSVPELTWVSHVVSGCILYIIFTRYGHLGLLGGMSFWTVHLLVTLPLSLALSDWWWPISLSAFAVVAGLAAFGFRVAVAHGKPLGIG